MYVTSVCLLNFYMALFLIELRYESQYNVEPLVSAQPSVLR